MHIYKLVSVLNITKGNFRKKKVKNKDFPSLAFFN